MNPSAIKKDSLTKRERFVYSLLHKFGILWTICGMYWYFYIFDSELGLLGVFILVFPCVIVSIFGLALRFDVRVIYGLSFLRKKSL